MFEETLLETTGGLEALVSALARVGSFDPMPMPVSDGVRVDQLAVLERVKAAVAAAQVRVTAAFVDSQEQVAQGWRERARECSEAGDFDGWRAARDQARAASLGDDDGKQGEAAGSVAKRRRPSGMTGVAAQVALARRESPVQGAGHVRLALALVRDMPHTLAALEAGELSEWRAQIIVRETATLSREDRSLVDAEVVGDRREPVAGLGDRELARRVRAVAYRVDAASVMARSAKAQADRRVTLRPAPDTMAYLTALLPVAQAVAAHAALTAAADAAKAAGDERGKGQVMADTLVERVTGQVPAGAVPVEVQLVMSAETLLAGADTPAQLRGYGTVPAQWARDLLGGYDEGIDCAPRQASSAFGTDAGASRVRHAGAGSTEARHADADNRRAGQGDGCGIDEAGAAEYVKHVEQAARVWLRRLFAHPVTGALVAMDSTRRVFDGVLRRFLLARDAGVCRTPWCDAPARHLDHVHDHADGGPTSAANGQGLCVRCNLTKQLPGFTATTVTGEEPGAPHTVKTRTPTRHTYTSHAPPLLPGMPTSDDWARPQDQAHRGRGPQRIPDHASPLNHPVRRDDDPARPFDVDDGSPEELDLDTLSPLERVLALALAA